MNTPRKRNYPRVVAKLIDFVYYIGREQDLIIPSGSIIIIVIYCRLNCVYVYQRVMEHRKRFGIIYYLTVQYSMSLFGYRIVDGNGVIYTTKEELAFPGCGARVHKNNYTGVCRCVRDPLCGTRHSK